MDYRPTPIIASYLLTVEYAHKENVTIIKISYRVGANEQIVQLSTYITGNKGSKGVNSLLKIALIVHPRAKTG
jgi:hypothetical protein